MKPLLKIVFCLFFCVGSSFFLSAKEPVTTDYSASVRNGVTPGYYLGFNNLADELRIFRRPPLDQIRTNLFHSLYLDFRYSSQQFNPKFYQSFPSNLITYDPDRSNNTSKLQGDFDLYVPGEIAHDMYGVTLGFSLGNNPNLDVKIPLSASRFEVDNVDDTGFVGGIELFPNYRINDYVAWGIKMAYINSVSDFPIFDESMTNISFEAIAESSPAYGMNWSGRLSVGNYYPSNDDAFWLYQASLAVHFHISQNFTFVPFIGINIAPNDLIVNGTEWMDYGLEFAFNPHGTWGFNLGMSGIGGHEVIDQGVEFYISTNANF